MPRSGLLQKQFLRTITLFCLLFAAADASGQVLQDTRRMIFLENTPVLLDMIRDSSFQRFTPTKSEIDSADVYLEQYFATASDRENKQLTAAHYYRQYVGLLIKGKKCIFVNASCRPTGYFLENTCYPKGGGQCYFRTLVELDDKKMAFFLFNAPK